MKHTSSFFYRSSFFLAAIVLFSCSKKETSNDIAWKRHVIDSTLLGSDGVRFEDANGDGLDDIATGWEQSGLTRIYFNPGIENVSKPWKYVTVGSSPDAEDAVLIDLDGDGAKDVISSSEGDTKRINIHWAPKPGEDYYNSALWITEVIPVTDSAFQWMFTVPAQIDGENGIDLIVAGKRDNDTYPQPYIGWLKAPKNPRDLAAWKWIPLEKVDWVMSVFFRDINADGKPDIVYSDRNGKLPGMKWLENPGLENINGSWKYHSIGDTTQNGLFMTLDDLDEDGKEDALIVTVNDEIHFAQKLSDDGTQWKTHKIKYPVNFGQGKAIAIGDINLDGKKDIVLTASAANSPKSGVVYLTYKNSVFDSEWERHEISGPEGIKYDLVPLVDIDKDGDLDVFSTEENNNSQGNIPGLGLIWYENPQIKKDK